FEKMRSRKVRVGTMDLRIAATALSNNLTLLTRNMKDFDKVPNLHTEDWTD
ncbi:MAG: type II toxin-antitoxin system VapC family toxin, partial [Cyanobacteria bacterium J06606_4]